MPTRVTPGNVPAQVRGTGTLVNLGPGTVYYGDDQYVTVASADGSLASGQQVAIDGTLWIVATGVADVDVHLDPAAPGGGAPDVGRSGSTPFSDGVVITDGTSESATHKFSLSPRTSTALTFPAASIRATTTNKQTAFDVMPNGTATPGTNGYAWIDVCDIDVLDAAGGVVNTARLAAQSDHVSLESYSTGGATPKPLWIRVPTDGTSGRTTAVKVTAATGGVAAADDYTITVATSIILAADGRSVVAGSGFRLKAAADVGFFYIPTLAGAPTGVPTSYGKTVAMAFDPATNRLWIYNNTGTPGWKSALLA